MGLLHTSGYQAGWARVRTGSVRTAKVADTKNTSWGWGQLCERKQTVSSARPAEGYVNSAAVGRSGRHVPRPRPPLCPPSAPGQLQHASPAGAWPLQTGHPSPSVARHQALLPPPVSAAPWPADQAQGGRAKWGPPPSLRSGGAWGGSQVGAEGRGLGFTVCKRGSSP